VTAEGREVLLLRGEVIPLINLGEFFDVPGGSIKTSDGVIVVLDLDGTNKLGIIVQELIGQQQVVIKSLEVNYGRIEGVAAATILGDGQVALILDVDAFARLTASGNRSGGQRLVQ